MGKTVKQGALSNLEMVHRLHDHFMFVQLKYDLYDMTGLIDLENLV